MTNLSCAITFNWIRAFKKFLNNRLSRNELRYSCLGLRDFFFFKFRGDLANADFISRSLRPILSDEHAGIHSYSKMGTNLELLPKEFNNFNRELFKCP